MGTLSQKVITNNAGSFTEVASINTTVGAADAQKLVATNASGIVDPSLINAKNTSAGSGDAAKIPQLNSNGILDATIVNSTVASAGAGSSGKLAALDSSGRLDSTVLPVGVGADTGTVTASEALSAGDLVNIWNNSGTANARKADATVAGKEAHGFVLAAVASSASATVYFEGTNTQCSGLTPGRQFLLTTAGKCGATAPSASGNVVQLVGFATSATAVNFQANSPITLA
jgi:hypothetical protein